MSQIDLERLVSAAAVDKEFRTLLLSDPLRAAEGYRANRFNLTPEEKELIAGIHASDYAALVRAVAGWILASRLKLSVRDHE